MRPLPRWKHAGRCQPWDAGNRGIRALHVSCRAAEVQSGWGTIPTSFCPQNLIVRRQEGSLFLRGKVFLKGTS